MSGPKPDDGRPVTAMTVRQMRVAMRNTVEELEDQKHRGITVEQIGPGKINAAFRRATQP